MENQILLVVTSQAGEVVASVEKIFDASRMVLLEASGSGTKFFYPAPNPESYPANAEKLVEVIVSDSWASVKASVAAAVANAGGLKKAVTLIFSVGSGKAIGAYTLTDENGNAFALPIGARVTRAFYDVLTTFTSAGADAGTISLGLLVDDVAGIVAATAISAGGNVWDAGLHEAIQTGTAATMGEKTTAARGVTLTVADQALTAGKMALFLEYVVVPTVA